MKNLNWLFLGLLFLFSIQSFAHEQIGQDIIGEATGDGSGYAVSISADGTRVAIGAPGNDGSVPNTNPGHVRIHENVNGTWVQVGQDIDGEGTEDNSGVGVSISADGTRVVIGAPFNNDNGTYSGHARIYEEVSGTWVQVGQDIDGEASGDRCGVGVSISADGTRVAIGAEDNNSRGHTRIYEEVSGTWVQIGQDINGISLNDKSGFSVSLTADGSRVAIGAPEDYGNGQVAGEVRIYEEVSGTWVQVGQDIDGEAIDDYFGHSVSISANGKRVAIGAPGHDGPGFKSGHVRVYEEVGGTWIQMGPDLDAEAANDQSGWNVAISADGTRVAVGAIENTGAGTGPFSGHTRIYGESNGTWIQIGKDIDGRASGNVSGWSVALSADGTSIAVGEKGNNAGPGETRVFKLSGIYGSIYSDFDQNCNHDLWEDGLGGFPVIINPGNYITETNSTGIWSADLPVGTYTLTVDTSKIWKTTCLPPSFTVVHEDSILVAPEIALQAKYPCTAPDISIHMSFMRRCFSDQVIRVQACNSNQATGILNNAEVLVTLDPLITATSFELPAINQGNNQYLFDLDSLVVGQCKDFWIKGTVDCAALLGQALCVQAQLFPVDPCVLDSIPNPFPPTVSPCVGEWDESSLKVQGYCQNNTIIFEIINDGVGDMDCYSPVTVYVDGVLLLIDSVMLDTQQVTTFSFPGNGESWHLEVEQHPNHPGNSQPKATVENCGGSTGQTKINLFAQDDADPIVDYFCDEVTGSYDPNDKTGYPIGLTADHHIEANQQLQYRIRFQNTGTDTAFTVVIRDTLDTDLDIFSVRSGVASHGYSFRMYGQRILEWTFNDIMLPDSNVNEPLSHGFVLFTVDQIPDLPDGTQITNSAGIYFDFNTPIITNIAHHEIHYDIPITVDVEEVRPIHKFNLYPNPNDGQFFVDLKKRYERVTLTLTDITGRLIKVQELQSVSSVPVKINSAAGIYLVKVTVNEGEREVFKVIKH